ncbi:MAG: sugar-binding domain-containing protein [bacterium]
MIMQKLNLILDYFTPRVLPRVGLAMAAGLVLMASMGKAALSERLELNFNQGWRFFRLDDASKASAFDASSPSSDDTRWEIVNLPHSVRLEPWNASGGQNFQGLCWYRKHFVLDKSWKGKKLFLEFGGAMQVAEVWINDKKITTHYGGYLPFVLDVTRRGQTI